MASRLNEISEDQCDDDLPLMMTDDLPVREDIIIKLDSPPLHPIASLQGAFEESIVEKANDPEVYPERLGEKIDSATRRRILLEQEEYEGTQAASWRQMPGQRFHPLLKLVAQLSFGIHLLKSQIAKSNEEVVTILHRHVDEVDQFLEQTMEDFDLAQTDIDERIRFLKLPLRNIDVFDNMLDDRDFRRQIANGNEKIDHIVSRTATAMNDALKDVDHGLRATIEFTNYLIDLDKSGPEMGEELLGVYSAMTGNAEGWLRCFLSLQKRGQQLGSSLFQLGTYVAEMQRRVGVASRKNPSAMRVVPETNENTSPSSASQQKLLPSPPDTSVNQVLHAVRHYDHHSTTMRRKPSQMLQGTSEPPGISTPSRRPSKSKTLALGRDRISWSSKEKHTGNHGPDSAYASGGSMAHSCDTCAETARLSPAFQHGKDRRLSIIRKNSATSSVSVSRPSSAPSGTFLSSEDSSVSMIHPNRTSVSTLQYQLPLSPMPRAHGRSASTNSAVFPRRISTIPEKNLNNNNLSSQPLRERKSSSFLLLGAKFSAAISLSSTSSPEVPVKPPSSTVVPPSTTPISATPYQFDLTLKSKSETLLSPSSKLRRQPSLAFLKKPFHRKNTIKLDKSPPQIPLNAEPHPSGILGRIFFPRRSQAAKS